MPGDPSQTPSPRDVRLRARSGELTGQTSGLAPGFHQANLVVLPAAWAEDFRRFCERNPRPCPVLEVLEAGSPEPARSAPGADLRTDLPRYRVFKDGVPVHEPTDVRRWWRDDLVSFLLGCSFTFEEAMRREGLPLRHRDEGRIVPMYRTSVQCRAAGPFRGPLVVSMRPLTPAQAGRAAEISGRHPRSHGAPVHVGEPGAIGIDALDRPDYGEPVTVRADEVPVFWACGVTPQEALLRAAPPVAVTHHPGHMFVTDLAADPEPPEGRARS